MIYEHFVITGSGRSGTRFVAEMLCKSGLPCAHQTVYTALSDQKDFRPVWRNHVGDSSAFAAARVVALKGTRIIHQVRDPRRVVASLIFNRHVVGQDDQTGNRFMARVMPWLGNIPDLTERAAAQWVGINMLVERVAHQENYQFHRVEDWTVEKVVDLFKSVGREPDLSKIGPALTKQPRDTGTNHGVLPIDLSKIKSHEFHEMRERYGYGS